MSTEAQRRRFASRALADMGKKQGGLTVADAVLYQQSINPERTERFFKRIKMLKRG